MFGHCILIYSLLTDIVLFIAGAAPLGAICGNILSGVLAEFTSWKWVFGVLAILSGMVTAAGIFVLPPEPPLPRRQGSANRAKQSIDWLGGLLITVGLIALTFSLTEGNVVGWTTPWVPVLIGVSLVIIAVFVLWQRYLENKTERRPLMKISMFHNLRFSAALLINALFFASFNNFLVFVTYYFQDFQGNSPLQTMIRFLPNGVVGVTTAIVVSQLLSRVPTYYILLFGNVCVSLASLLFAAPISPHTSYFAYALPALCLSVMGSDTTWPSLTLFVSQTLPQEDQAMGGALINAVGLFGRGIGLAISTAAHTAVMANARGVAVEAVGGILPWDGPSLQGMRVAFWVNVGFGLAALLVVALAFRGSEIVGKTTQKRPNRGVGEESVRDQAR
jgi:Na+/melibiose symporter-like transporter